MPHRVPPIPGLGKGPQHAGSARRVPGASDVSLEREPRAAAATVIAHGRHVTSDLGALPGSSAMAIAIVDRHRSAAAPSS